jgi:hypothetical protein
MVKTALLEKPSNACKEGNIPKTINAEHANKNTLSGDTLLKANTKKTSINNNETIYKSNINTTHYQLNS